MKYEIHTCEDLWRRHIIEATSEDEAVGRLMEGESEGEIMLQYDANVQVEQIKQI